MSGYMKELSDGTLAINVSLSDNEQLRFATVRITSAQLKAIKATPITILPAPASGYYYELVRMRVTHIFATAAYTTSTSNDMRILFAGTTTVASIDKTVLESTSTAVIFVDLFELFTALVRTGAQIATSLRIDQNGTDEYTTGGGALEVQVEYRLVQIPT